MLKGSITKSATLLLVTLPGAVLAHPGHGSASALQHDWEHALWFGAAVTAAVWGVALLQRRIRRQQR